MSESKETITVTMKGRVDYEAIVQRLKDNKFLDDSHISIEVAKVELLLDIRDFLFSTQQVIAQQTQASLQLMQMAIELNKLMTIVTKVVGEYGAREGWIKKVSPDNSLEKIINDAGGGIVDLNKFRT